MVYGTETPVQSRIVIANQKGGVGKTTIADSLADALERDERSVGFVSVDPQSGARHADKKMSGDEEFIVVDTRGSIDDFSRTTLSIANLIIVPMEPGELSMNATLRTYQMAREVVPDVPVILIINKYTHFKASRVCVAKVRSSELKNCDAILYVPQRAAYANATYNHRSIFDEDGRAAAPIRSLASMCESWHDGGEDRKVLRKMAGESNWFVDMTSDNAAEGSR